MNQTIVKMPQASTDLTGIVQGNYIFWATGTRSGAAPEAGTAPSNKNCS